MGSMIIFSYMEQLTFAAEQYGVDLDDAAQAEGIAGTTLWRWRARNAEPRLATTQALIRRMEIMAKPNGGPLADPTP